MMKNRIIFLCFFLSGAAGLMYEIIWTRFFSLTFGATTYSITTVLTAFMAGLAFGSLFFGRIADRIRRRLMFYGWIELLIGLYALIFPFLFGLSSRLYLYTVVHVDMDPLQKLILKFTLSFLIMLIPTTLMGGSLPVLSRAMIKDLKGVSSKVGALYAINTFGAVVGTFLVGFYFLSGIGLRASILVAAFINIGIGILMILFSRRLKEQSVSEVESTARQTEIPFTKQERRVITFAVAAFMISGFVSLSHEVVWTRILSLIIGSSTYAFSMILIGFLIGIALGSYLISHTQMFSDERINLVMFSWIEIGIGFSAFALIPLFSKLPYIMLKAFQINAESYNFILSYQFVLSLLIVIVPTTLMGATLPVIAKIVSREVRSVGRSIGNIYFFNTFGAIFGSFLAGFLFIPFLGTLNTLKLGVGVNLLLGAAGLLLSRNRFQSRWGLGVSLLVPGAVLYGVLVANWDPTMMDKGVAIYGKRMVTESGYDKLKDGSRMLYLQEGINATISVRKKENKISLLTGGKADASTGTGDMTTQTLSGYLPVMLHPKPERIFVVGLASGVTAGTVAQFDEINLVDVVEIEPSMAHAASFFQHVNQDVLANPKVHLIINDGRNHLLETKAGYDLIISEPSNPWISGVASLFTSEYFQIVNQRLNPGGIFCQWVQCYSISLDNLRMILKTLAQSFQDVQLWTSHLGDLLLIASNEEIVVDRARIDYVRNLNRITESDFSKYLSAKTSGEVFGRLLLDREGVLEFSRGARTNSDNYPYLEFSAPKDIYRHDMEDIYQSILETSRKIVPQPVRALKDEQAQALFLYHKSKVFSGLEPFPKDFIQMALALDDNNEDFYTTYAEILLREKKYADARKIAEKGLEIGKTSDGIQMMIRAISFTGTIDEAFRFLDDNQEFLQNPEVEYGNVFFQAGLFEKAIPYLEQALRKQQGEEYLLAEKLGRCYEAVGDLKKAEHYYELSVQDEDMNPRTQGLLGGIYWKQGRYEEAAGKFLFMTQYWDVDSPVYLRLADCYKKLNQPKKAAYILEKVLPGMNKKT